MRSFLKFIAFLSIIPILIGLFFFSNIKGYYRFKDYCEKEGGLRVYEPLEKNMGWIADDKRSAQVAALLSGVSFVRYIDKHDGQSYDIRYINGDPQDDSSFEKKLADASKPIVYRWRSFNGKVADELPFGKSGYEVSDYKSDKVLVRFYMAAYAWFDSEKTPLSTNVKDSCFREGGKSFYDLPRSLAEINSSFKGN